MRNLLGDTACEESEQVRCRCLPPAPGDALFVGAPSVEVSTSAGTGYPGPGTLYLMSWGLGLRV